MRLPVLDKEDPTSFDFETIEKLFDTFLAKGFTYFDTAYTYHGYECEKAVRRALVEISARFDNGTGFPVRRNKKT